MSARQHLSHLLVRVEAIFTTSADEFLIEPIVKLQDGLVDFHKIRSRSHCLEIECLSPAFDL